MQSSTRAGCAMVHATEANRGGGAFLAIWAAVACVVTLLGNGCAPAVSTVVVGPGERDSVLVRTNDELAPGDAVLLWEPVCELHPPSPCRQRVVARGIVRTTVPDRPEYAFVEFAPGTVVHVGDRMTKEPPMSPWHRDPPAE